MNNPYLEEFNQLPSDYRRNGEPLANFKESSKGPAYLSKRHLLTKKYSWAVPTEAAIDAITHFTGPHRLVEFGSGTGYWASLLACKGVSVAAIEPAQGFTYYPSQIGSFEWLARYRSRALMLCWPPYATRMALRALEEWDGQHLVYVGEPGARGCADPHFFDELARNWELTGKHAIPQWYNRSDEVFFYNKLNL